jgi:hypothetical protein
MANWNPCDMKFPYALSDFGTLRREGYFYQDRSDRIAQLEETGRQLVFIRPRRFGKTLLLSMLEHYYDVNRADEFEALFGDLAVGRNPTPRHNSYLVLKWDFSLVKAQGSLQEVEAALHRHLNDQLDQFIARYGERLRHAITIHPTDAVASLGSACFACRESGQAIYLLIDEYDNFANELLMVGRKQADYERLL